MKKLNLFSFPYTNDEIETNRISNFTNTILLASMAVLTMLAVIKLLISGSMHKSDFILWTLIGLIVIIYVVFKKLNMRLAGLLYVIVLWGSMTLLAWTSDGVRDVAIVAYIISIFIAIYLTRPWQTLAISLLSILSIWVLFYAEKNQIIIPGKDTLLNYCIDFTVILTIVITLIYLNNKSYILFYARIKQEFENRLKAEAKLQTKEILYQSIFENANDAIFIVKEDRFIECNRKTLEIFECTKEQIINQTPYFFSPEQQPDGQLSEKKAMQFINLALKGTPQRFEWQHLRFDMTPFEAEVSLNRLEINNEFLLQAIVRDITENKVAELLLKDKSDQLEAQNEEYLQINEELIQANEELLLAKVRAEESEAKLTSMFECSRDAIGVAKNGIHIFANPSYLKLFGFENNEKIIGTSILDSIAPSHRQFILQNIQLRSADKPAPRFYEARCMKVDGTEFDAEFNVSTYELNGEIFSLASIRDITERKHSQLKLQLSEEKFSKLFHLSPHAVLLTELKKGKIIEVNKSFEKFSGFSRDELIGNLVLDLNMYSPADRQKFISLLKEHGNFHDVEFNLKNKAGLNLFVLASAELIEINEELHAITNLVDITERKNSQEALRQSEEKFSKAFHMSPQSMSISSAKDGIYHDVNKAFLSITGFTREEVIGTTSLDLNLWVDNGLRQKLRNEIEAGREINLYPVSLRIKSGEVRDILYSASQVLIGGEPYLLSIVFDITEQKRAEEKIRESEERYRSLFEGVPIGLYRTKSSGQILDFNLAAMMMLGFKNKDEMLAQNSIELWVHQEERKKVFSNLRQNETFDFETQMFRHDKKIMWVRNRGRAILNDLEHLFYIEGSLEDITESKRADEKLRESEKRFRDLTNLLPQAVFETDLDGILTYANQFAFNNFGYTQEDFSNGLFALNMIIPEDRELARQNMESLFSGKNSSAHEYTALRKDGSFFPVIIYTNVIVQNDSNIGLRGIFIDITNIKQAQETLRKSEEKYSRIVNTANEGIIVGDKDNIITYLNKQMCEMFGYKYEEAIGRPIRNFILENEISDQDLKFENRKKGIFERYERHLRKKDGTLIWVTISSTAIFDPVEGFQGSFGMVTDITERRNAEIALIKSEARLQKLINSITDYIYTVKIEKGKVIDTVHGEGCITVTGYSTQEFKNDGYLWYTIIYDNDREAVSEQTSGLMQIENAQPLEHRIVHKNGSIRWVRNTPVLHFNSENKLIGYDGLIEDITELKEAQRQILSATIEAEERERNYFARELHDGLGPLLSSIKLYFQWYVKPESQTPKEELLTNINAVIQEAITSVKEISHKLSPHILMNFGLIFAVKSFIDKLKETSRMDFKFKSNIGERLDKDIEISLYRVIIECINNTLKYANAKKISIGITKNQNQIFLEYSDNGIGFTYDETVKSGKGLGLFNMQNRIEILGGKFEIKTQPGKGIKIKVLINI